jgi:hypothetical protein
MSIRGFTMSLDQLQATAEEQQKDIIDPLKNIGALMEAGLQHILTKLGVDVACEDEDIQQQMIELGIFIQERDEQATPKANGFYVFQGMTADTLSPVAFVSSPYITNAGKASVTVELYRDDIQFEIGGIKLPVY